ncbi:fumarylacetoacetate hydrolase family protein [uncultured Jatrophihabitans sp.]|uniref:fumarylacetoacetate hydrolase family protein n=1 Tax=uncultured Jatrophihabitans sp. TaxID=1610747 RepID=UPI0035C9D1EC
MTSPSTANWALVTVTSPTAPAPRVGVRQLGGTQVRIPEFLRGYGGVLDVIHDWAELEPALRAHDGATGELVADPEILLPLRYPAKVLCSGPNYRDHLAEMKQAGLGDSWTAYFFFKPPTTSLVGPTDPVLVGEDWATDQVDWEGELAVVMARGGRDIAHGDALSHVAGYCVANDISLRGPHRRDTPAAPFVWDWVASKGADTSLPIGPGVVPAWQIDDVQQLPIRTRVNGELRQDGNTSNMVLDVATMVAQASELLTLEPGDVIVTGTPAGVGASSGTFLTPGDVVDVDIPGVGQLRNTIERRSAR